MNEPEHEGFVYQVLSEGTLVIVMADHEDAAAYAEECMKGQHVLVLPIPVFKYKGRGGRR